MGTFLALTAFAVVACFVLLTLALIGLVLKTVLWLVFFPIRILFKLLFWVVGMGLAALLLPLILIVAGIAVVGAIVAALLSLLAPLLPVAMVGLLGWAIYRVSTRRPSPVI